MAKTVAVDDSLKPLTEALKNNGYNVTNIGDPQIDAIILNGIDDDFMGMEDVIYDVPIVNAEGKTSDEILTELKRKF